MNVCVPPDRLRRAISTWFRIGLVLGLLGGGTFACNAVAAVAKDRFRLSVMTLNISGALPKYSSNPEVPLPWRDRYTRISDGFKALGIAPDIIALQEVTARKEWIGTRDPRTTSRCTCLSRTCRHRSASSTGSPIWGPPHQASPA